VSKDNPINLPSIEAIAFLADTAMEEPLEFTEIIALEDEEKEIEEDFWEFLASCQTNDATESKTWGTKSEPDWYSIVDQIEQALIESEQKLELQIERSRTANRLIARQTEELNETQARLSHLLVRLETTDTTKMRQEEIIDRLTDKLQQARKKTATIERECCALQAKYQQQNDRLLETEARAKELSHRLDRQQRYTLQFKNALNDCLEEPISHFTRAKPIPTWSQEIYRSLQSRESSQERSPRQKPSFSLSNTVSERESHLISDVNLPKFSNR
jgi:chromosome segregation ATPase